MSMENNSSEGIQRASLSYARKGYYALRSAPSGVTPEFLLIALHGWGQSARWFARRFEPLGDLPIFVAAPQGPHQFYLDIESKKVGFNWLTAYEKQDNIDDVNRLIDAVVAEAQRQMGDASLPVYVLGFSQGSVMAWRYALHAGPRVAGVVACCADLAPDVAERLPDTPPWRTLLVYGTEDGIVPQAKIDEAQEHLTAIAWPHDVLEFEGGHDLLPGTVHEIGQWIANRLPD